MLHVLSPSILHIKFVLWIIVSSVTPIRLMSRYESTKRKVNEILLLCFKKVIKIPTKMVL